MEFDNAIQTLAKARCVSAERDDKLVIMDDADESWGSNVTDGGDEKWTFDRLYLDDQEVAVVLGELGNYRIVDCDGAGEPWRGYFLKD